MNSQRPYFIGIAGGTASGKTTLCKEIIKQLNMVGDFTLLTMDNFYKDLTAEQMEDVANYNFDAPDSLDFDEMHETVQQLLQYKDVEIPDYDFSTNSRKKDKITVKASHFILFEGILALYDERLRDLMDFKIFVYEDADTRLLRRIKRDTSERGRTVVGVLHQWHKTVKPLYDEFVHLTLKTADIIVNGNSGNWRAVNFVVSNLKTILNNYINAPNENGSKAVKHSEKGDSLTEMEPQRSQKSSDNPAE